MRTVLLGLGCALALLSGCTKVGAPANTAGAEKSAKDNEADKLAEVVIPVEAEHPTRGEISAYYETTSRVEAEDHVAVTAEAVGKCLSIHVEEGDSVRQGDVLAELDKKEAEAALHQSEAQFLKQRADYERVRKSREEDGNLYYSDEAWDSVRFAYEQAKASREMQEVQLSNLTIRAPISGVVTKKNLQVGQMVSTGSPVFNIVDPTSYMLVINPPEQELPRLQVGQVAKVTIDALPGKEFAATIDRINPSVDAATGTVKVTLKLDKETRKQVRESAFARARLVMETHTNALLLRKDAVIEENARKYVFIVKPAPATNSLPVAEEAKTEATADAVAAAPAQEAAPVAEEPEYAAERIEVTIGLEDSVHAEILSGVDESALVVTMGQHTLRPGSKVKVTNASAEMQAATSIPTADALAAAKADRAAGAEDKQPRNHHP